MGSHTCIEVGGRYPLLHLPEHRAQAEEVGSAVESTLDIVSRWGLLPPREAVIVVMTHWDEFIDLTVPVSLKALVRFTRPLWARRAARAFELAGGWMQPWPGRPAVGVKPAQMLARDQAGLGSRLFVPIDDSMEKLSHLACHEFTHACTAHLRLPPWLNEGLAMRAVDHLAGYPTVRESTRDLVVPDLAQVGSREYRRIAAHDHGALLALYATGYWATRSLDDSKLTELRSMLARRRRPAELAREAAELIGQT